MRFTDFLKSQLVDFVEVYRKYFTRTFGIAVTYASVCFVIAALLLRFSNFDKTVTGRQISLLSYLFHRYSKGSTYSLVDLVKSAFIFFVCLFSLGLYRVSRNNPGAEEFRFKDFLNAVKFTDILWLLIVFILTSILDFSFTKVAYFSALNIRNANADIYVQETFFHLRIYVPLILFTLTIWNLVSSEKTKITFKTILFLYISLWLYNEFAYEISAWVRGHVFGLVLMRFGDSGKFYLFESLIGIPLIAFFFLGYYSAMTGLMRLSSTPSKQHDNKISNGDEIITGN